MWRLRIMLVSLLGLSLVVGFAVPVGADPPAEESVVPADAILAAVIEASTCDPSVNPTQQQFGLTGASRVIVTCEPADGSIQPQFQVGLGWYIYVYLNRGDWLYLAGLGYAGGGRSALLVADADARWSGGLRGRRVYHRTLRDLQVCPAAWLLCGVQVHLRRYVRGVQTRQEELLRWCELPIEIREGSRRWASYSWC